MAIKREAKVAEVEGHISRTYVKQGKQWVRYITPEAISREITSFDRGAQFEPGDYKLRKPAESERLEYERRGREGTHGSEGGKKKYQHHTVNIRESAN